MECLIFDLDDTLYSSSTGIESCCSKNIVDFMVQRLCIPVEGVEDLCLRLYKSHGTTMAGLIALGYAFDFDEYHEFVHGRLPYHVLREDPALRSLLLSLPHRKIVFTNADRVHASKVLSILGVEDCFEKVINFDTINPKNSGRIICKPSLEAFERAISIAGVDPAKTLFFDDSLRNIEAARLAGLRAVLVGRSMRGIPCIKSVHTLKQALPVLWQEEEGDSSGDERMEKQYDEALAAPSEVVSVAAS
ncbi:hypothetical protein KP509_04G095900 [Ceratopteris richardii]|uniref:Uncharacterized protein n=1 Tax=Ceratopteris richardii TaxID=49495 RepID=A0A8T2V1X2_CERRI|nr:hypothetical protein KP509_04G095900 [Ceratopteris richardii]